MAGIWCRSPWVAHHKNSRHSHFTQFTSSSAACKQAMGRQAFKQVYRVGHGCISQKAVPRAIHTAPAWAKWDQTTHATDRSKQINDQEPHIQHLSLDQNIKKRKFRLELCKEWRRITNCWNSDSIVIGNTIYKYRIYASRRFSVFPSYISADTCQRNSSWLYSQARGRTLDYTKQIISRQLRWSIGTE